jgi:hypothetical protein
MFQQVHISRIRSGMISISVVLLGLLSESVNAQNQVLKVNESITVTVWANRIYNDFACILVENGVYKFTATRDWVDDFIRCGPEGFASTRDDIPFLNQGALKLAEPLRRMPAVNWFCLCGEIDRFKFQFKIGSSATITIPAGKSGKLSLWANDVLTAYGNNKETLSVTIKRIS